MTCLFCDIAAGSVPAEIVAAEEHAIAFLDHRPVFEGHTLVIPRAHLETLPDVPAPLLVPVFDLVQRLCVAMTEVLAADGTWVSENNIVSQSVPHLHIHVVPRRRKDGLRGFYWPRNKYASDEACAAMGARLREALIPPRRHET